ncbi:unnamed protein product [Schistosoma turkestanicum]|nr:unnamed protein product [Schistosoma turkestanicum]
MNLLDVSKSNSLSRLNLLSSDRLTDKINILFSHFIPFHDMIHIQSRRQRYGIVENFLIENLDYLPIGHDIYVNFTNMINYYYEFSTIMINKSMSMNNDDSTIYFEEKTFLDILRLIIGENATKAIDYLHYIHTIGYEDAIYVNFVKKAYEQSLMPKKYIPGQPWYMLLMHSWRLYYLLVISSSSVWLRSRPGSIIYEGDLPKTLDEWSVIFIYLICSVFESNKLDRDYQLPYGFCPNPCLNNPCLEVANTVSSNCIKTGYFENSYKCECRHDYEWKQVKGYKGYCEAIDLCDKYCDKSGTRKCDIIEDRYFCVCRPTHMGSNCNYKRDPCVELASNVPMAGNIACNVANGGVCKGTLGTDTYYCQCPKSFTSDPTYPNPNCLQIKDQCASTVCIHGDCVSSKNGQETYCICPEGRYGKYCELTRGQWAQWSSWSECSPNCGLSNNRKRTRTRNCLGEACSGSLGYLHLEFCDIKPCSDEMLLLNKLDSLQDFKELKLKMLQVKATHYIEISGRIASYLLLLTCIVSAITVTAMIIVAYYL